MKKLLRRIVIGLLVWFGYRYVMNNPNADIVQKINSLIGNTMSGTVSHVQYTVKTIPRTDMPGEDIHVYDQSGQEVLSFVGDDPQYLYKLAGNYLILDIGTSASQRTVAIYDIPTKEEIFESTYYPSAGNSLVMNGTTLQFFFKIWSDFEGLQNKPANAPTCSELYNGYTETRTFDMTTKILTKTGLFTCAYFE